MRDIPDLDGYNLYERYAGEGYDRLHRDFDWQIPDRFNIADYVCDRWAAGEGGTALYVDGFEGADRRVTFRQLRRDSDALAAYLAGEIDRGDRIAVCTPQRSETIVTHLAAWKLGAISVPLSTLSGTDGLRYRLRDSGAKALVTVPSVTDRVPSDVIGDLTVLTLDREASPAEIAFDDAVDAGANSGGVDPVRTDPEQPAMINYTSGTTGDPKGIVHAHRHLLGVLPTFCTSKLNLEDPRGDVTRTVVDWSWTGAFNNTVLPSLYFGIPVVGSAGRFDPATEFELIERYDITLYNCPPTAVRKMMDADASVEEYDVDSVRTVAIGGEPVDQDVVEWTFDRFDDVVVHEVYGQTEAPTFVGDCTALGVEHRPGRMGKASPGHSVRVVDPDDPPRDVPVGDVGELALECDGNPLCFEAYWNGDGDGECKVVDGWLLTEDLVRMDDDGYLSFYERKDDVIITSGYRIAPAEIEGALASHDAVRSVGVIGKPDEDRGQIPKAFVVPGDDAERADRGELKRRLEDHVKESLAKYSYPREIEFREELPRTTSGKVDRSRLERE